MNVNINWRMHDASELHATQHSMHCLHNTWFCHIIHHVIPSISCQQTVSRQSENLDILESIQSLVENNLPIYPGSRLDHVSYSSFSILCCWKKIKVKSVQGKT